MAEGRTIQVGILGDNTMIQAGLRAVLAKQTDIEFVEHPDRDSCDVLVLCGPPSLRSSVDLELTHRETEVLRLLSLGLANKEIAFQLKINEHTVKFHVSSIFTKLGATNRVEAVRVEILIGLQDL